VVYLVYLGVQQWRAPARPMVAGDDGVQGGALARRRDLVLRGWMVNTINPKGTVFLLAVVPQFLALGQPLAPQYLVIALTLGFTDLVVMGGYTALAAKVLGALTDVRKIRLLNRGFGTLFVGAGLLLAGVKRA
jgi:homoserine/homoserine lactone efflux protein